MTDFMFKLKEKEQVQLHFYGSKEERVDELGA